MEEALPDVEGADQAAPGVGEVGLDVAGGVVPDVGVLVDDLHDPAAVAERGVEHHAAVPVGEPVVGDDLPVDEGLEHVVDRRPRPEERLQMGGGLDLPGAGGAHPDVGLGDERVSHLGHEVARGGGLAHQMRGSRRNSCAGEEPLHAGLALDHGQVGRPEPGDVEVLPQAGLGREPVFAHGIEPIQLSVAKREESQAPHQVVVPVHVRHPVVLGQRLPELGAQPLPGLVGHRQGGGPGVAQGGHEVPEVEGEVGERKTTFTWSLRPRSTTIGTRDRG